MTDLYPNGIPPYAVAREGAGDLRHEGVNRAADAAVTLTHQGVPYLLLVQRRDRTWALPGGRVEDGEDTRTTAARELAEETGLLVDEDTLVLVEADRYVPDPRATRDAVMHTDLWEAHLGTADALPHVGAGDGTLGAEWIPAGSFSALVCAVAERHAASLFPPHVPLLFDYYRVR